MRLVGWLVGWLVGSTESGSSDFGHVFLVGGFGVFFGQYA